MDTTPTSKSKTSVKTSQESDYSPIYFTNTQESNEDIDVLWDWHSPQTSERKRRKQKRLLPTQSPKVTIKRHPSNQNFDKLRDELKFLQEQLAIPDDESSLCVSPQQEKEFKEGGSNNLILGKEQEEHFDDFDDMFNDSLDDKLVLFTQKVEENLVEKKEDKLKPDLLSTIACVNTEVDALINKYTKKEAIVDDSFDKALIKSEFKDTDSSEKARINNCKTSIQRAFSDNHFNKNANNVIKTVSGKLEIHRTKSFEMTNPNNLPKSTLEEIERKRLEALAKLELKRKQENSNVTVISPVKCSLEEIEKKRLQALAKLQSKQMMQEIERKRQEALKRLQVSRLKNVGLVKGTLSKKL